MKTKLFNGQANGQTKHDQTKKKFQVYSPPQKNNNIKRHDCFRETMRTVLTTCDKKKANTTTKCTNWPLTNRSISFINGGLVKNVPQHGQDKGHGLAAASLGNANEVTPWHYCWNGLGLDRSRALITVSTCKGKSRRQNLIPGLIQVSKLDPSIKALLSVWKINLTHLSVNVKFLADR